jgi:uncharacterized protein YlxW (UPF0749 family)
MQIGDVRIVASTSFRDDPRGVDVDGTVVRAPYTVTVIGDAHTLADSMGIPGGVLDTIAQFKGAAATVTQAASVRVDALKVPSPARYAHPVPTATATP